MRGAACATRRRKTVSRCSPLFVRWSSGATGALRRRARPAPPPLSEATTASTLWCRRARAEFPVPRLERIVHETKTAGVLHQPAIDCVFRYVETIGIRGGVWRKTGGRTEIHIHGVAGAVRGTRRP